MTNGTILFSTVPVGRDSNSDFIVTVHVAPRLGDGMTPVVLQNWANDVQGGHVLVELRSKELTSPLPAALDGARIHPELWQVIFGEVSAEVAHPKGRRAANKSIEPRYATVNLRDALNNATDFYERYVKKIDVTDASSVQSLYQDTIEWTHRHSVYALNPTVDPNPPVLPTTTVRSYLQGELGKNLPATRLFGNVEVDSAFLAPNDPRRVRPAPEMLLNASAQQEIATIHNAQAPMHNSASAQESKGNPAKRQHIIHHIHRLRSVSRRAPANMRLPALTSTLNARGTPSGAPMSFAQRLALLQGIPVFMESLALVLVFKVPGNVDVSAMRSLRASVSFSGTSGDYTSFTVVAPNTAIDAVHFLPEPDTSGRTLNPIINPNTGYLDVSSDYEMGSLQLESSSNHVYNFSNQAAVRLNNANGSMSSAVTQQLSEDYTHVILPRSPHTDGLYVYQHERQNKMRARSKPDFSQLTDSSTLYAEDLFHSVSVDMQFTQGGAQAWTCLSVREEAYFHRDDETTPIIAAQRREHGVRSSATRPTDSVPTSTGQDAAEAQRYQIDETVFAWRRGSLALKDSSGGVVQKQSKETLSTQQLPWTTDLKGRFSLPSDVMIPEPRFGNLYPFALRPIYITGWARPFDATAAALSTIPKPQPLLRNELVLGPRLIKRQDTGSRHCDTQELMVVASHVENPQDLLNNPAMNKLRASAVIERSVRYVVPAATTAAVARRHGMRESDIQTGAKSVPLKKDLKKENEGKRGHGALPDTLPLQDSQIDDSTIYLPDPICSGVRASLLYIGNAPLPNAQQQLTQSLSYYTSDHGWPNFILHGIELRPGKPGSAPALTIENYFPEFPNDPMAPRVGSLTIVCTLPPGMTAVLELTPTVVNSERTVLAFAPSSGNGAGRPALEDTNLCRPTILRMVHATDIPVAIPSTVLDGAVAQRNVQGKPLYAFDRSSHTASVTTTYEPYTTGKVEITATWTEMVDNPNASGGSPPARLASGAALFTRQLPKLQPNTPGVGIGAAFYSDESCPPQSSNSQLPCALAKLPFDDTRYRRLILKSTGVARHGTVFPANEKIADCSREAIYDFLSTAPPPVPDVEYILPTFEWQFKKKFRTLTQTRKTGFAVMLNRPWFSSGDGEQLAVITPATNNHVGRPVGNVTVPLPSQYPPASGATYGIEEQVSAWGTHAIWPSAEDNAMTINLENASSVQTVNIGGAACTAALFDPVYDEVEDRWYCNLAFSEPPTYGAMMRLVLARYQPHSINATAMLSAPVLTDFSILSPTRVLQVKRHLSSLDVQIVGVGPNVSNTNILPTRFEVRLATATGKEYEFPWREAEKPSEPGTSGGAAGVMWSGSVKFDFFATHRLIVREFEQFRAFEAAAQQELRDRLVYASAIDIPHWLF